MAKMNHEHRNKMQKVYDNPPQRKPKKIKRAKVPRYTPNNKPRPLTNKFKAFCLECLRDIPVGKDIYWFPQTKDVVHDYCLEAYLDEQI